jgi:hypothetical protein
MPAAIRQIEQPERAFPQCREDPELDRTLAEAQARLSAHMLEMNDSGLLLDPPALRLLRTYATQALSVAITYRRRFGPCGYGCRHPGLHCPVAEPLPTLLAALGQDGWTSDGDLDAEVAPAAAVTCVCGDRMHAVGLRRGRQRRAWATCGTCEHWTSL